jgi:hypothetical protein
MNDTKIDAEKLANKLKIRILELVQNPAPKRYGLEPQPEMMPAVYWPMEWLVETIITAMTDRDCPVK